MVIIAFSGVVRNFHWAGGGYIYIISKIVGALDKRYI